MENQISLENSEHEEVVEEEIVQEECVQSDFAEEDSIPDEEVTDYTAKLWKYHPVPQNEPDEAPEYITKYEKYAGSTIIGARVRGKKHKHEGTNCDDYFETASYKDITFIAVSDGAGSKRFSRVGANVSCKVSVGYMYAEIKKLLENESGIENNLALGLTEQNCIDTIGKLAKIVQDSVIKAYNAVENAHYSRLTDVRYSQLLGRDLEFKDFSGTLLVSMVMPVNGEEKLVISCQIGDGMIALVDSQSEYGKALKLMGIPDSGEFSGETEFLTSDRVIDRGNLQSRTKISVGKSDYLFVMTDGVADDYFPNETEMLRLFLDLQIHRIIPISDVEEDDKNDQELPEPMEYPWINDNDIKVKIQSVKRISKKLNLSLESIWENKGLVKKLSEQLPDDTEKEVDKLKNWLDNYVERGSFDDRTLVIARI